MKEGWVYKKLGEVCEILNGFAFKSNLYIPNGIRVIRITNVQKGYIEDKDPKFYPDETLDELRKYVLNENDLLISLTGNVGRVGIIDKSLLPAYLNQRVGCIRVKNKEELLMPYLYFLLNSNSFENDCVLSSRGAAQKNMSTVWLSEYEIPIPSLFDQRRIVSRLDSAFSHIDELKAKAEKQLSEAKALFQKALAEEMKPKEGWVYKKLGEVANVVHGKNQKDVFSKSGQYPIYGSGGNIMGYADDFLCEAGTTILGRKGSINNPQFIKERFWNVDTAFGISAKKGNDSKFIYYFIKGIDWSKKNTGTTLPSLTQLVVKSVDIPVPSLEYQRRIVSHLDALSSQVHQLEENCRKTLAECDALKQAMLREVFE